MSLEDYPRPYLTTQDISDILGPLATKCAELASFPPLTRSHSYRSSFVTARPTARTVATYSHRHRQRHLSRSTSSTMTRGEVEETPPLAVLGSWSADALEMELIKRVRSVVDDMWEIMDVVYPDHDVCVDEEEEVVEKERGDEDCRRSGARKILTLRDLCSVVAGRHILTEADAEVEPSCSSSSLNCEEEGSSDNSDRDRDRDECEAGLNVTVDDEKLAVGEKQDIVYERHETDKEEENGNSDHNDGTDEIYEVIFPPYRGRTLISHAFSLLISKSKVMANTLSAQTLLSSLLTHVISLDLNQQFECISVVRALLSSGLTPTEHVHETAKGTKSETILTPPICHPAHTNWLVDLHMRCCSSLSDTNFDHTVVPPPAPRRTGTTLRFPPSHYIPPQISDTSAARARKRPQLKDPLMTNRTFVGLVLDALDSDAIGVDNSQWYHSIWSSTAMEVFMHRFMEVEFACFLDLIGGLARFVAVRAKSASEITEDGEMRKRFAQWVGAILDRVSGSISSSSASSRDEAKSLPPYLHKSPRSPRHRRRFRTSSTTTTAMLNSNSNATPRSSGSNGTEPSTSNRQSNAAVDLKLKEIVDWLLITIRAVALHKLGEVGDGVVCLLVVCLCHYDFEQAEEVPKEKERGERWLDREGLVAMLREVEPKSGVFDWLTSDIVRRSCKVENTSRSCSSAHLEIGDGHVIRRMLRAFLSYGEVLGKRGLVRLEAAWWASALRGFEGEWERRLSSRSALFMSGEGWESARAWLVERVEEVEGECFGVDVQSGGDVEGGCERQEGEWKWEEMVGCYVRKSPAREMLNKNKKRKVMCGDSSSLISVGRASSSSVMPDGAGSPTCVRVGDFDLMSTRSGRDAMTRQESTDSSSSSSQSTTGSGTFRFRFPSASPVSSNTTPEPSSPTESPVKTTGSLDSLFLPSARPASTQRVSRSKFETIPKHDRFFGEASNPDSEGPFATLPSSDDALNLFNYRSSSPDFIWAQS